MRILRYINFDLRKKVFFFTSIYQNSTHISYSYCHKKNLYIFKKCTLCLYLLLSFLDPFFLSGPNLENLDSMNLKKAYPTGSTTLINLTCPCLSSNTALSYETCAKLTLNVYNYVVVYRILDIRPATGNPALDLR